MFNLDVNQFDFPTQFSICLMSLRKQTTAYETGLTQHTLLTGGEYVLLLELLTNGEYNEYQME